MAIAFAVAATGRAQDTALDHEIRRILADEALAGATTGIRAITLEEGKILFSRGADLPLTPGSNMKLFSTAVALRRLGPDYRFATEVRGLGEIRDGVLQGDLVVVGGGDPLLSGRFHDGRTTAPLEALALQVREAGVRRVGGALVLDARFFDRETLHPSWPDNQLHMWYCAPISGLALNDNCVDFLVGPGSRVGAPGVIEFSPRCDGLEIENEVRTAPGGKLIVDIRWGATPGSFRVIGSIPAGSPAYTTSVPVREPVLYFGRVFREILASLGIEVDGETVVREAGGLDPRGLAEPEGGGGDIPGGEDGRGGAKGRRLARIESTLVDAIALTNERSQNFCAEQILKTLGREIRGEGSFDAGRSVVREDLEALGIWRDSLRMDDGSGLSRKNRGSARAFTDLLRHMYLKEPRAISEPFLLSLPVGGVRGSLGDRFDDDAYRGRVAAKTGYVKEASALSGFARTRSDRTVVFSILMNGFSKSNTEMKALQDRIVRLLIDQAP